MPILRNVWLANLVPNSIGTGVVSPTDPLGNVTTTAYDNLQRRTTLTQPNPDAGGGLSAPAWAWIYGSHGLLETMADPPPIVHCLVPYHPCPTYLP